MYQITTVAEAHDFFAYTATILAFILASLLTPKTDNLGRPDHSDPETTQSHNSRC